MFHRRLIILLVFIILLISNHQLSFAEGESIDYSDAPASYGQASHKGMVPSGHSPNGFVEWLGANISADTEPPIEDTFDDGTSWSSVQVGQNFEFTFNAIFGSPFGCTENVNVEAWIDYNQNGSFDIEEKALDWFGEIYSEAAIYWCGLNPVEFPKTVTRAISVPQDAISGNTWIRVRLWWEDPNDLSGIEGNASPIGQIQWGEVEDYQINISAAPDNEPPSVNITNPGDNSTVSSTIDIQATATDNIGVNRVDFFVDNVLKSTDTTAPYSYLWDSTTATDANHTITTIAYDDANNNNSQTITANVDNLYPKIGNTINVGNNPRDAAANPNTNKIYIANYGSDNISVIDDPTDTVISTIGSGNGPKGIALNPQTNMIYTANEVDGTVSVIDGNSNTLQTNIAVGTSPFAVDVNRNTNKAYVTRPFAKQVVVLNLDTNSVETTVPSAQFDYGIGANANTNKIYIADWDLHGPNNISVIDGSTNILTQTVTAGNGYGSDLAINETTNMVYAISKYSGIMVFNGASNSIDTTIPIGSNPLGIAVNKLTNRAIATNMDNNNASVIDTAINSVVEVMPTGNSPRGIGINPLTSKFYATNFIDNTVTVIEDVQGNDNISPNISITNPTAGSSVSEIVDIKSQATDNIAVNKVEFYVDNTLVNTDSTYPYEYSWDSTAFANGNHIIKATAYDASTNTQSDQISVNVSNAPPNLISNGSFENDNDANTIPDNWSPIWFDPTDGRSSESAKEGGFSLKVAGDPAKNKLAYQHLDISGSASDDFIFFGMNKTDGASAAGGFVGAVLYLNHTDGSRTPYYLFFDKNTHDWVARSKLVSAYQDYASIDIIISYGNQTGTAYFDDFKLYKTTYLSNTMDNPSFETDADLNTIPDNWSPIWFDPTDGRSSESAKEGGFSLKVAGDPAKNKLAYQHLDISGSAGNDFVFYGWNKTVGASAGGGFIGAVLYLNHPGGARTPYYLFFDKNTHDWVARSTLVSAYMDYTSIDIIISYGNQTGTAYFDDFKLLK